MCSLSAAVVLFSSDFYCLVIFVPHNVSQILFNIGNIGLVKFSAHKDAGIVSQ